MKIGFISLGCAKNLVDSEMILSVLSNAGCEIVSDPQEADAIFINTCGFIEPAKKEAIETIEEMATYNKKLIVVGCYAERYKEQIEKEMPYVDKIITLADYPKIHLILNEIFFNQGVKFLPLKYENRLLATSPYSPYVKIGDGCNNNCTYCAIPLIRGKFRSRPYLDVLEEVKVLAKNGAKEINLISQDTTRFGSDYSPDKKSLLPELISEISKISGIRMIRFLYLYPDEVTDELLDVVKANPLIVPYFDIPIQHISTSVLKKMNRRGDENFLRELFLKIRKNIQLLELLTLLVFPMKVKQTFKNYMILLMR